MSFRIYGASSSAIKSQAAILICADELLTSVCSVLVSPASSMHADLLFEALSFLKRRDLEKCQLSCKLLNGFIGSSTKLPLRCIDYASIEVRVTAKKHKSILYCDEIIQCHIVAASCFMSKNSIYFCRESGFASESRRSAFTTLMPTKTRKRLAAITRRILQP